MELSPEEIVDKVGRPFGRCLSLILEDQILEVGALRVRSARSCVTCKWHTVIPSFLYRKSAANARSLWCLSQCCSKIKQRIAYGDLRSTLLRGFGICFALLEERSDKEIFTGQALLTCRSFSSARSRLIFSSSRRSSAVSSSSSSSSSDSSCLRRELNLIPN